MSDLTTQLYQLAPQPQLAQELLHWVVKLSMVYHANVSLSLKSLIVML